MTAHDRKPSVADAFGVDTYFRLYIGALRTDDPRRPPYTILGGHTPHDQRRPPSFCCVGPNQSVMGAIVATDLHKRYGDLEALSGLSLSVGRGELVGLLGPNGAGKTTTIAILTGQLTPDDGSATVLGVDPSSEGVEARRNVGILPEKESPPSFLTPREYFAFVGTVRGIDPETRTERVEEWADRLGFAEQLDTFATDLSRGQQQKVMIAAAFLHEPAAVFIDEPLANLDPIVQERVKRFLREYADAGNAVLLSTHHIEVAAELCDRVCIVRDGVVAEQRIPRELGEGETLLDAFVASVDAAAGD